MKTKTVIAIATLIIVTAMLVVMAVNNLSSKETKEIEIQELTIESFIIEDRETLKVNNAILVGNNIKELENDFYDIKIINTQQGIEILLNKLWYENYDKDYIQENYLAKICRQLTFQMGIKSESEEFEYVLYKYIKENYVKVRQGTSVEGIVTEDFTILFELQDNIAKLIIRGR